MKFKNKIQLVLMLSLAIITIFTSCKKEEKKKNTHIGSVAEFLVSKNLWYYDAKLDLYMYQKEVKEITDDVVKNGAVLTYYNYDGIYIALPAFDLAYAVNKENLALLYNSSGPPDDSYLIRLVILNSTDLKRNPDVDLKNYEEVKKVFNIAD